jgi:spermidine synthase
MFARKSFLVHRRNDQAGRLSERFHTHAYVPSFGEWGSSWPAATTTSADDLPNGLRFLAAATLPNLFDFPSDMARVSMPGNHLNDQVLVRTRDRNGAKSAR